MFNLIFQFSFCLKTDIQHFMKITAILTLKLQFIRFFSV